MEHLDLDGRPASVGYKRVRVQARQIAVYAQAALMGCAVGVDAGRDALSFVRDHARRADGGIGKLLSRDGRLLDPAHDLYDTAFVLFACAWHARLHPDSPAISMARDLTRDVTERLRAPDGEGFQEHRPATSGDRLQNPHMHLLEAMLALADTTGEDRYHALADDLVDLFRRRIFNPADGTVSEKFDKAWNRPCPSGDRVEPGHVYEWISLLLWDEERRTRRGEAAFRDHDVIDALFSWASTNGHAPGSDLVVNGVFADLSRRDEGLRIWPQTEAIRAHALRLVHGLPASPARLAGLIRGLRETFLSRSPAGTWTEAFDARGVATEQRIPASTLYHIMGAWLALERLFDGR
ncbi:AGE family epimerase/isomerase [Alsobacter sp. R-9]